MTEIQHDILSQIVDYGGYCTVDMVSEYSRISKRHVRRIMGELCELHYLTARNDTSARNISIPYQVTKKACVEFGLGDSHMRRKHEPLFRARSLLRASFLFSAAGETSLRVVSFSADKIQLLQERGIPPEALPRKVNGVSQTVQVEETLILSPPYAPPDGLCVLYPDKRHMTQAVQLNYLSDNYRYILKAAHFPIVFLIICEDEYRCRGFQSENSRRPCFGYENKGVINTYSVGKQF